MTASHVAFLALFAMLAIGCETSVIVRDDSTSGGSTESTPPRASELVLACGQACGAIAPCATDHLMDVCVSRCTGASSSCHRLQFDFLECAGASASNSCDLPDQCVERLEAWLDCESWCLDPEVTSKETNKGNPDAGCRCWINACGPTLQYESECFADGDISLCQCFRHTAYGSEYLGNCVEESGYECPTDTEENCCATLFFASGG